MPIAIVTLISQFYGINFTLCNSCNNKVSRLKSEEVEFAFGKESALARNVKMFLCQKYTGEKLERIGKYFGIGESGVFRKKVIKTKS